MSSFWGTMWALPRFLACVFFLCALALSGCGDGTSVAGSFDASPPSADASTPAEEFDHFGFVVSPTVPLQDQLFEVVVTAYSSSDESQRMSDYDGVVTMSASVGNLSAGATSQVIDNGKLTFSVSLDASGTDVVLTVSDDQFSTIRGSSSPLYISPPGDTAGAREVVINEVNWFGNHLASTDEWIEIRNVSGGELNLSEWTLEGAGSNVSPIVQLDNGTSLADGDYLLLARRQGADVDGERSALTGLSGVQIHTMELGNAGEALFLRDVAGTTIDQTPSGAWPAGDNPNDLSMERRDELTGGGYTDGAQADAWYTWSSLDTVQTSNVATSDRGTPGTTNSNPDLFDHFGFEIQPTSPKANFDFTITITAYTSADDTEIATGYNGSVSLSALAGALTGEVSNQPMSSGVATLTVRSNTQGPGQTITVSDSIYPDIVGTSPPFEVLPEGDPALLRQVVISEINYFGNSQADADEWIELRNVSGETLNLAGWTIEAAGTGATPITIASATFLADGEYLVLADRQGPDVDTMRTSVTGVAGVQLAPLSLVNGGEHLVLRDVLNTVIDETPDPGWPAGSNAVDYSMERRDELHGGYTDGALDGAWYTWSSIDGASNTSADTSDFGTPGTSNSDPDLFDHFTFTITPAIPIVGEDFVLDVQAFASADESTPLTAYNGTITITEAVAGALTGQVLSQPITAGAASVTLQFDRVTQALALTVRDDIYPEITGVTADIVITDTGDDAAALDVVISEVNWFGNDATADEWVEIRNISGAALDLSGWTIDGLATGSDALVIASNTVLAAGAYLVLGDRQGDDLDGSRTSLTGVAGVQVNSSVALSNGGDPLTLRDIDGTVIDQTPAGAWTAGDAASGRSMERRDDVSGGGYSDGGVAGAWYTWNPQAGTDTTSADSSDSGTPGADNSDPNAVLPALLLPYSTSFESGEPAFENLTTGGYSSVPPPGTAARTGGAIATTGSITSGFTGRQLQSADCLLLNDDTSLVEASAFAIASTANGGNGLAARLKLLWFTDEACATAHTTASTTTTGAAIIDTAYSEFTIAVAPPLGATHLKIRFEIEDDNGGTNTEDDYAVDDVTVAQPQGPAPL